MIQRSKSRHGGIYYYFFRGGRQDRTCDHLYIPVEIMEKAIIQHYGFTVSFPKQFQADIRASIDQAATDNHELSDHMRDEYDKRLAKLDTKESYFLDLATEEG
jgi:hypothetical protein